MRLSLLLALSLLPGLVLACASSTRATGGDAGTAADAGVDAGPPARGSVETFVELETSSEGLAFGGSAAGGPLLYFGGGNALWSATPSGTIAKVADVPAPLGIALMKNGDLVVCGKGDGDVGKSEMPGVLWRVSPSGARSVLLAPGAISFKLTNFVVVSGDGTLVFSDSAGNKVYSAKADGTGVALVTDAITYPNGMAYSADGKTLYVASWNTRKLYSLPRGADGTFGAPEVYFEGVENVDGITVLGSGELLLVASGEGVVRVGLDRKKTSVADGSNFKLPANGAFGGGPFGDRWLYVTNLLGRHLSRVYIDETGIPLPPM